MQKSILLALFVLLVSVSQVSAESAENVTKRRPDQPIRAEIQEIKTERSELREAFKESIEEKRSQIASNHADRLEKRFNAYYARLASIILRFEQRLALLKSDGKSVASVETDLSNSKAKLEEAKFKGTEAVAAFRAIDPTKFSEQKAELKAARDAAELARKLFKESHELLKKALKSLKAISKPALPASSAAVNNSL